MTTTGTRTGVANVADCLNQLDNLPDVGVDTLELALLRDLRDFAEARHGWDGITIRFGDGADHHTVRGILGSMLGGWVVDLTLVDGTTIGATDMALRWGEGGDLELAYLLWDEDAEEGVGEQLVVPFDHIVEITVN